MHEFPVLDPASLSDTRDALHAYARVLGDILKATRVKRKHWWHASLRPSLAGLTTGVVHHDIDFEVELDLRESTVEVRTATGVRMQEQLYGQPASVIRAAVHGFLEFGGVAVPQLGDNASQTGSEEPHDYIDYSSQEAIKLASALSTVAGAMAAFRAGLREESSPIQVWPHHFDLSMIWLPGNKVPGQDAANEEYADKQMNFGFVFGDESFNEPYFYVTAYPSPEAMTNIELPAGVEWETEPFNGAVLRYDDLLAMEDPAGHLQEYWSTLLAAGLVNLANDD